MEDTLVVVVGAGVAGLACARALVAGGIDTVVLERARGVGGRCATRRVEGQPVDHGLPFLHASGSDLAAELATFDTDGILRDWPHRVLGEKLACQPDAFAAGVTRVAHRAGVSRFAKHLAAGLDVRLERDVVALEEAGPSLIVRSRDGAAIMGEFVILAGSLTQSLRLVDPWASAFRGAASAIEDMRSVEVLPVLTVIAGYPLATPPPEFDLWHPIESTMVQAIVHDSAKRADPSWRVLVLHARPSFAVRHVDDAPESWAAALLWEAGELLGDWAAKPAWQQAHRWRSGRVRARSSLGAPSLFTSPGGGAAIAIGDAFGPCPGLEGAYLSGTRIARRILHEPERLRLVP